MRCEGRAKVPSALVTVRTAVVGIVQVRRMRYPSSSRFASLLLTLSRPRRLLTLTHRHMGMIE